MDRLKETQQNFEARVIEPEDQPQPTKSEQKFQKN
jgi:hypothetical protein